MQQKVNVDEDNIAEEDFKTALYDFFEINILENSTLVGIPNNLVSTATINER